MLSASYTPRPLTPFRRAIARFSLSEMAKYTKLTLGLWIGFAIPYALGYHDSVVGMAGSAMLTLALGTSISEARGYFYRRVVSNLVAMPLGTLIIWLTAPNLWLGVFLLPLLIFAIVRIKPSLFQMTSITVPMTLVLYTGEHIPLLEHRLIGVVFGMLLGFIIEHVFFPPDHGYWANTLVNSGNEQATDAIAHLAPGKLQRAQVKSLTDKLRKTSADLKQAHSLLKLDMQLAWVPPHLKRNRARLPLFRCYQELFDTLVTLLETFDTFHEEFAALDPQWKGAYAVGLGKLLGVHRLLAQASDLRVEPPGLEAKPLHIDELQKMMETLPATSVFTSVYLGHLTGYGISLRKLTDMLFLAQTDPSSAE